MLTFVLSHLQLNTNSIIMIDDNKPHPHDSMPIANGTNKYAPPEKMNELEKNPRPEEEVADDWFESDNYASRHESSPEFEKDAEEIVTMHEKAYRMARSKYNPFAVGGSENIHDFD